MKLVAMFLILLFAVTGPAISGPVVHPNYSPVESKTIEPVQYWAKFNQEVWFRLGVSYLFKEKYVEAYNAFYSAITYDPLATESYQNLAFVAFKMGDFREAAAALSVAIELNPNNAEAHHLLGIIYTIYAMYENAIEELEKALVISPQDPLIHYDLGFAREFGGHYVLAQESYKMALQFDPEFLEAQHRLGVVVKKAVQNQEELEKKGMVRHGK